MCCIIWWSLIISDNSLVVFKSHGIRFELDSSGCGIATGNGSGRDNGTYNKESVTVVGTLINLINDEDRINNGVGKMKRFENQNTSNKHTDMDKSICTPVNSYIIKWPIQNEWK